MVGVIMKIMVVDIIRFRMAGNGKKKRIKQRIKTKERRKRTSSGSRARESIAEVWKIERRKTRRSNVKKNNCSTRGRKTRRRSVRGRRTEEKNTKICHLISFHFGYYYYLLLVLLFPFQLPNLFLKILYFIVIIIDYRYTYLNFGIIILV